MDNRKLQKHFGLVPPSNPTEENHTPSYYPNDTYEPLNVIDAWGLCFRLGNTLKYIARAGKKTKDPLQDLVKARHYLDLKIKQLTKEPVLSEKSWLDPDSYNLGREVTHEYDIPDFTD